MDADFAGKWSEFPELTNDNLTIPDKISRDRDCLPVAENTLRIRPCALCRVFFFRLYSNLRPSKGHRLISLCVTGKDSRELQVTDPITYVSR